MAYSAELQAALIATPHRAFYCLDLTLPDATTARWSDTALAIPSAGMYLGKILEWGEIQRSCLDRSYALETSEFTVAVEDLDGELAALICGEYADDIEGSPVTAYLGHLDVTFADWAPRFTGVLARKPEWSGDRLRFTCRPDDRDLRGEAVRLKLNRSDFSAIAAEAVGAPSPLRYGVLDSAGVTDAGYVVCPCIDKANFRYLVGRGYIDVTDVFEDGAITAGAYVVSRLTYNGRLYTIIDFSTSRGTAEIRADVLGVPATWGAVGTPITNGATVLAHYLTNHVFADHRAGAYGATTSRLDATLLAAAEAYCTRFGYDVAVDISQDGSVLDEVNRFASSLQCRVFWTPEGKLGLAFEDNERFPDSSTPLLNWSVDEVEQPLSAQDEDSATDFITGTFCGGSQSLSVGCPTTLEARPTKSSTLEMPWLYGTGATSSILTPVRHILSRRLRTFRKGRRLMTMEVPIGALSFDLCDEVRIAHHLAPNSPVGWSLSDPRPARVLSILERPASMTAVLILEDLRHNMTLVGAWDTGVAEPDSIGDGIAAIGRDKNYLPVHDTDVQKVEQLGAYLAGTVYVQESEYGLDRRGYMVYRSRPNIVPRSSFVGGSTGWTLSNAALDTAVLLFDPAITTNSMKLTTGGAGALPVISTGSTVPFTSSKYLLTVDGLCNGHTSKLQASIRYTGAAAVVYNWDGAAWVAGAEIWLDLEPEDGSSIVADKKTRFGWSDPVDFTLRGDTATGFLRIRGNDATPGRNWHVFHVQFEDTAQARAVTYYPGYPTGRIVTTGATDTEGVPNGVRLEGLTRARTAKSGAFAFTFVPTWDAANRAEDVTLAIFAYYPGGGSSGDRLTVRWDASAEELQLVKLVGATTYTATIPYTPVRDQPARIAGRFVSAAGEGGFTPHLMSVFLDGVKGTDVVTAEVTNIDDLIADDEDVTVTSVPLSVHVGGAFFSGTNPAEIADGGYRHWIEVPFPPTDSEMKRLR